ncbi:MAG: TIGR02147 family protein [Bdellovibrionota bacterium]
MATTSHSIDLYAYESYRLYLSKLFETDEYGRGAKARLARALGCGNSFVSQVLMEKNHLSLEQGIRVCSFLTLSEDERSYFVALIQLERAGTRELSNHFRNQILLLRERNKVIQQRIAVKSSLSTEDQSTYYSSWIYGAVHILTSVPELRSKGALSHHLQVPVSVISEALEFLVSIGAVMRDQGQYCIGKTRIHLGRNSPNLTKHHTNWRMQALQAMEKRNVQDIHYSSVMALAPVDAEKISALLLNTMAGAEDILKHATEKSAYCLGIDFFEVKGMRAEN